MPTPSRPGPKPRRVLAGVILRCLVCLIVAVFAFYGEEDWRGKRAWKNYRHKLEAAGASLDWTTYIPAAVPDAQNVFKAPHMNEWFTGETGNELTSRLNPGRFVEFLQQRNINTMVELRVVSSINRDVPIDAQLVLQYNPPFLSLAATNADPSKISGQASSIIPIVVMDEVPLLDAIKNVARLRDLKYKIDSAVSAGQTDQNGNPAPQPNVSLRWTNVTAHQALSALLNNYNLRLVEKPGETARIVPCDLRSTKVVVDPAVGLQMTNLIQAALSACTNGSPEPGAIGSLNLALFDKPLPRIRPLYVFVQTDTILTDAAITEFFPSNAFAAITSIARSMRVAQTQLNSFRLALNPDAYTSAADYIAWSDQFQPDFDVMREALKRPYARLDGDYTQPFQIPHPNFQTMRMVSQTLSQRAQCYLLLSQPDQALRELTLLHNLCRLVKTRPTELLPAMFDVALTSLYTTVVADGLRLHAWREPQLLKLQQQLKEIDLLPSLVDALNLRRAAWCHLFETATSAQCNNQFAQRNFPPGPTPTNLLERFQDPVHLLFTFAPRGWIYQNMLCLAESEQKMLACLDVKNHLVLPQKMNEANLENQNALEHHTPRNILASRAYINTTHATSTLALNQTLAREALIACALERYHLVHHCHPETLNALVPQFLEKIPSEIIGGQPLKYRADKTKFVLYSIGWNEKDDGGIADLRNDGSPNPETADWVWPNREKPHR